MYVWVVVVVVVGSGGWWVVCHGVCMCASGVVCGCGVWWCGVWWLCGGVWLLVVVCGVSV